MINSFLGVLSLASVLVAISLASYFSYSALENFLLHHVRGYLDEVTGLEERMFRVVPRRRVAILLALSTSITTILAALLFAGAGVLSVLAILTGSLFGWFIPRMWVTFQWRRRLAQFDQQLVDGLTLMANSLKSGLNLSQVIQVLVQEMPNPISQEFGLVLSQQKLGLTLDEALEKMMERLPSDDLSVAVHSILILRETGGDLSETFETISTTIRERRKVDGKIHAVTMQGRVQGLFMLMMPLALGIALYAVNHELPMLLFATPIGRILLGLVIFLQIIGGLWIRKIIRIEV